MKLKIESIPNSILSTITDFFIGKNIVPTINNLENRAVSCFNFDLEIMAEILQSVPELRRRPWMFDASDDVVECEASNRLSNGNIELWFSFNDLVKDQLTFEATSDQMAILIDDCNFATLNHRCLEVENCIGRTWGGEEIFETTDVTVFDWVDSFGQNRKDITKIFVAYLLRFGQDWLKSIAQNTK